MGLIKALDVALGMIEAEGLEQVFERHALLGRATREAAKALDLELLGGVADENANVVTAIALPDSDRRRQGARSSCATASGSPSPAARAS